MWKNKEFRIIFVGQIIYSMVVTYLAIVGILSVTVTMIVEAAGLILSNLVFTCYRYREMRKLTTYLAKLQNGQQTLDIRDNNEGELSILKNEIYSLSVKLNSQSELLLRDKTYLSDSLSDISHQLKTPLTSMMMMVELLEQESLPEQKRREFLQNISVGIERMEWLVQALLKLSKFDADAVLLKNETIDVYQLLKDSVAPLMIALEIRDVNLELTKLPEKITMCGDYQWTCEAITNIVKNCMEHTPANGKIQITYSDNNLYTKITIEDTGTGITKEDLPHIFERFYKGKNSKNDSVGIGLALSKEIIVRQKGKIEVSSKVGVGTRFELRIYR